MCIVVHCNLHIYNYTYNTTLHYNTVQYTITCVHSANTVQYTIHNIRILHDSAIHYHIQMMLSHHMLSLSHTYEGGKGVDHEGCAHD